MKSIVIGLLIVFVVVAALGAAQVVSAGESGPSLSHLTKFVGKDPSGIELDKNYNPSENKINLINDKAFRIVLTKALDNISFNKFMKEYDFNADKVEQKGQIIYFTRAKHHFVGSHKFEIFINLADNSIEAYWLDGDSGKRYWFSSKSKPRIIQAANIDGLDLFKKYGSQQSSTAAKSDTSPCQGVTQTRGENIKNKADLERAITKQLTMSNYQMGRIKSVTVVRVLASGNWSIVEVDPDQAERVSLFYDKNPLTSRYVTMGGPSILNDEENESTIMDDVLKSAPGIPPQLASCFAKYVMYSVGPEWGKQYKELFK